jgi:hypothetical protein
MKKIFVFIPFLFFIWQCTNSKKEVNNRIDSKILLRADIVNMVKLTDTLLINQSVCRACAYEQSTHFEISDTVGIIQLINIITTDNNPSNVDGGSINKDLLLMPVKTGITTIKMWKFDVERPSAEDSARFSSYTIEVTK